MEHVVLDHLAFGVPDIAPVAEVLVGQFGAKPKSSGPGAGFQWWQWEFLGGGAVELLRPDGPPGGFLHRFLADRGAGPHHLTFKVPSVEDSIAHAREFGYEPVGFDDSDPTWIEVFLHPKQAQGIVVQMVEQPNEADGEESGSMPPPFPDPPEPGPPVRPLGVLLSARSEERARLQWEQLLGGQASETDRGLRFEWSDSPLRVDVVIEADAPEGPLALEFATEPAGGLPEGPHPLLGLLLRCAGP